MQRVTTQKFLQIWILSNEEFILSYLKAYYKEQSDFLSNNKDEHLNTSYVNKTGSQESGINLCNTMYYKVINDYSENDETFDEMLNEYVQEIKHLGSKKDNQRRIKWFQEHVMISNILFLFNSFYIGRIFNSNSIFYLYR